MNVELKRVATAAERAAEEQFATAADRLPGGDAVRAVRRSAIERFAAEGLPHRRIEDWKYTDLRSMLRELPAPAAEPASGALEIETLAGLDAYRVVTRDGGEPEIASELAHVAGVEVTPLAAALDNDEMAPVLLETWSDVAGTAVFDLNTAFMRGGVVIRVTEGTKLDKPIMLSHIVSHLDPSASYVRNLVVVEAGAEASVVETFEGPEGSSYLVNTATRFAVADRGKLDWLKVQGDGNGATHLSTLVGDVAAGAEVLCMPFATGAAIARNQIVLRLNGPETNANVAGVQLLAGRQHGDVTMFVDHAVPDCTSRELFKAVLDDRARGVFQGKILVRQRRPEDRRQDDDAVAHAVGRGGDGQQAGAGDLRRRRAVRPRRHVRPDRRRAPVLPPLARHSRDRGEGAADRGLHRRGARPRDQRGAARGAVELRARVGLGAPGRGSHMNAPVQAGGGAYDVASIRRDFPILGRQVYGRPLVYLDNAASAQKPRAVIEAMTYAMENEYANVHRGLHYLSNTATENFERARERVRTFLNAPSSDQIVFTRNATEAINLVANGIGASIGEGDEIVLSIMEHHSNIVPWHFLRERKGAVIRWAPVDEDGNFLLEEFEKLLGPKTRMVAITHMSNMLGSIVPVAEVVRLAHERGIRVLVDGSQGAVHLPVDVQAIGADYYVFTGHKVYGPTGIGVLYGTAEALEALPPFNGGGEMIDEVTEDGVTYQKPPHRFEAGTPPIVEASGLAAALDYMDGIGRERIRAHEDALTRYALERLRQSNSVRVFGDAAERGAIVSFEVAGAHAHDVSTVIDRYGVAVRAGTHCVQPLLARFGVTSTCRASFGMYNTMEEVDRLVEAIEKAQEMFA